MLDLDFDQEQELLRHTVRDVLARHCPLEVVREMEDDPVGYPAALWTQLAELDLIGLLLPEEYGGSGMSLIEGVALYEELGRALAPTPHFVSAVLSGGVLAAAGSDAHKEEWLRPVASGEAILTPAWLEPALVLLAAQAVGGARYALEITTQYAKDRHQFDKPLGAFQALAHYLADAVTNLDGAEQLVHEAAWAGATGRPLESLAPMAKLFACSTFRDITAMAQQLFGGIGFTLDFDIQLYFRRAKQQQLMWANDRVLEDAVAASLFD